MQVSSYLSQLSPHDINLKNLSVMHNSICFLFSRWAGGWGWAGQLHTALILLLRPTGSQGTFLFQGWQKWQVTCSSTFQTTAVSYELTSHWRKQATGWCRNSSVMEIHGIFSGKDIYVYRQTVDGGVKYWGQEFNLPHPQTSSTCRYILHNLVKVSVWLHFNNSVLSPA